MGSTALLHIRPRVRDRFQGPPSWSNRWLPQLHVCWFFKSCRALPSLTADGASTSLHTTFTVARSATAIPHASVRAVNTKPSTRRLHGYLLRSNRNSSGEVLRLSLRCLLWRLF